MSTDNATTKLPVGTVVLPQGDPTERIVGLVLKGEFGGFYEVVWFSDLRGAFVCVESESDLTVASQSGRSSSPDLLLDHANLARAVRNVRFQT